MKINELKEMMAITTIETAYEFVKALSSSKIRKSVKSDMLFELNEKLGINIAFQSENWIENRDLFLSVLDEIAMPKSDDKFAHLITDINPKWDNAVYVGGERYIQAPTSLPEARKHVVHSMKFNYRQVFELDIKTGKIVASLEYERTNAVLDTGLIKIQKRGIGYVTKEERKPTFDTKQNKFTISTVQKTYAQYQELLQNDLISITVPEKILKDILSPDNEAAKIYLVASGGEVDIFYYNRKRCGWYSVTSSKRNGYKEMPEGANKKAYYAFPASPSEKRKFGLSFLYVGSDTLAEFNYRVETIINKANSNGFDFLRKVFGNDPQNYATMAKIEARLSLGLADSAPVKGPKCFAYYNGSFGENNGVEPFDGYAFVTNRYVAKFLKTANYAVDEDKTAGLAMQGRVGFIKGYFLTIELAMIKEMIKYLDTEIIVVSAKEYEKTLAALQKGDGIKNAIYIFGADNVASEKAIEEIDFFGDKNAVKAQFDYLANSDLRILEIPAKFKNYVNTSNQILGGLMNVEGAAEVFKQIAEEHLDKIFSVEPTGKISRIKQIAEIDYVVNTLLRINPQAALNEESLRKAYFEDKLQSAIGDINGLNFKVKGRGGKVNPDLAAFFGLEILKKNEVYVPGMKDGVRGAMFRSPKTYEGEFVKVITVSYKTIRERLYKLYTEKRIGRSFMKALMRYYKTMMAGNIIVNSNYKEFAGYLGGIDFDGDAVIVIFDERLVELAYKLDMGSVDYGKAKGHGLPVTFGVGMTSKIYYDLVCSPNKPIGQIINMAYSMVSIWQHIDNGFLSQEDWIKFQEIIIKDINTRAEQRHGNTETEYDDMLGETGFRNFNIDYFLNNVEKQPYEPQAEKLLAKTLLPEEIYKWIEYAYTHSVYEVECFKAFLKDLVIIEVAVSGHTLDAAKSAAKIHAAFFWMRHYFRGGLIENIEYKNDQTGRSLKKVRTGVVTRHDYPCLVGNDILCQLKNSLVDRITNVYKPIWEDQFVKQGGLKTNYYNPAQNLVAALSQLATMRNGLSGDNSFKNIKEYLVTFARLLTARLSYEERFCAVKLASMTENKRESRFWLDFGTEVIAAALDGHDGIVSEKLYSRDENTWYYEDQVLSFEKGRNATSYLSEKLNGNFKVGVDEKGNPIVYTTIMEYAKSFDKSQEKKMFVLEGYLNETETESKEKIIAKIMNYINQSDKLTLTFGVGKNNGLYGQKGDKKYLICRLETDSKAPYTKQMVEEARANNDRAFMKKVNLIEMFCDGKDVVIDHVIPFQNVSQKASADKSVVNRFAICGRFIG